MFPPGISASGMGKLFNPQTAVAGSGSNYTALSFSGVVGSGYLASGQVSQGYAYIPECYSCGCSLSNRVVQDFVRVIGMSGLSLIYCWKCAGFSDRRPDGKMGFEKPEEWIKASVPLSSDTPPELVADYLRDMGCDKAADYMLDYVGRMSGNVRVS